MPMDPFVQNMRKYLIEKARTGDTVTYTDLASGSGQHDIDFNNNYARNSFINRLKTVLQIEVSKGRPCLTILVVEAISSRPADYFFEMVKELNLNHDDLDNEAFFLKEKENVIASWKDNRFYDFFKNDVD